MNARRVLKNCSPSRYAAGKNKPPKRGNNSYNAQGNGAGPRSFETRHNPTGGDIESAIWTFDASIQKLYFGGDPYAFRGMLPPLVCLSPDDSADVNAGSNFPITRTAFHLVVV